VVNGVIGGATGLAGIVAVIWCSARLAEGAPQSRVPLLRWSKPQLRS
jgi:hypothetical protein